MRAPVRKTRVRRLENYRDAGTAVASHRPNSWTIASMASRNFEASMATPGSVIFLSAVFIRLRATLAVFLTVARCNERNLLARSVSLRSSIASRTAATADAVLNAASTPSDIVTMPDSTVVSISNLCSSASFRPPVLIARRLIAILRSIRTMLCSSRTAPLLLTVSSHLSSVAVVTDGPHSTAKQDVVAHNSDSVINAFFTNHLPPHCHGGTGSGSAHNTRFLRRASTSSDP